MHLGGPSQAYEHAWDLVRSFGDLDVTVMFLLEVDKLVRTPPPDPLSPRTPALQKLPSHPHTTYPRVYMFGYPFECVASGADLTYHERGETLLPHAVVPRVVLVYQRLMSTAVWRKVACVEMASVFLVPGHE
jgi:hypothetical protein